MTIFRITRRYLKGDKPWEVSDHTEEYTATLELAHEYVRAILGDGATCDDNFGFMESWTAPHLPRIEYLIDSIRVLE